MRTVQALVKKEFKQVFRDHNMLRMIFLMPFVQLLILGYAINTDVKNIHTAVYDHDRSELSRDYIRSFTAGDYFVIESSDIPLPDIARGFAENRYNTALIIPEDFSEKIENRKSVKVGLISDGTNANSAGIAIGYAGQITRQFNLRLRDMSMPISLKPRMLFNPESESINFMIPGIVALLLTMVTVSLTSLAIVREREMGTLEQLMVTPITTPEMILGKTIPFAVLGFVEMSVALAFGVFWFDIPFVGSWLLLYVLALIYLFTTLGTGMFISTVTSTQQQAMFFTWFFTVFTILTSGFFNPIENMPQWMQFITYLNPLRYFMQIIRGIMMKGSGLDTLYSQVLAMVIFGTIIFSSAWLRLSKRIK